MNVTPETYLYHSLRIIPGVDETEAVKISRYFKNDVLMFHHDLCINCGSTLTDLGVRRSALNNIYDYTTYTPRR